MTSIDGKVLQFVRLEEDTPISSFDCGDIDLNDFLQNDAKNYLKSMLAVAYLIDAYRSALSFYERNDFRYLTTKDEDDDTRTMYFDLKAI